MGLWRWCKLCGAVHPPEEYRAGNTAFGQHVTHHYCPSCGGDIDWYHNGYSESNSVPEVTLAEAEEYLRMCGQADAASELYQHAEQIAYLICVSGSEASMRLKHLKVRRGCVLVGENIRLYTHTTGGNVWTVVRFDRRTRQSIVLEPGKVALRKLEEAIAAANG